MVFRESATLARSMAMAHHHSVAEVVSRTSHPPGNHELANLCLCKTRRQPTDVFRRLRPPLRKSPSTDQKMPLPVPKTLDVTQSLGNAITESQLRSLSMGRGCLLGDEGALLLMECIRNNSSLQRLQIRHSQITSSGANRLAELIQRHVPDCKCVHWWRGIVVGGVLRWESWI